jgi:hypothetical protein
LERKCDTMPAALSFALQLLQVAPSLISAGQELAEMLEWGRGRVQEMADQNRDPTDEEWNELNSRTQELRRRLHD